MRQQSNQTASSEAHLYNAAFHELDLSWQWDPATYGSGREGLRAYDADFLVNAVEFTKDRLDRTR